MHTRTTAPCLIRPRPTSAALYAAIDPDTPPTMRRFSRSTTPVSPGWALLHRLLDIGRALPADLVVLDLPQGDREGLHPVDCPEERRERLLLEAGAELRVVVDDLTRAPRGQDDQRVLV